MRVAVVGAGVVGVTTAYELAREGHAVEVFESRGSVASEASFANGGVIAPGYVTPWASPGMPGKVLRHLLGADAPVRFGGWPDAALLRWLWRWWRACTPEAYVAHRQALFALARESRQRLDALTAELKLDYEQRSGYLVLLRAAADVALARPGLKLLAELGADFRLVDAARCREIEPALHPDTALAAGIHLPHDGLGNCRQFTNLLKTEAQRLGVEFRFHHVVRELVPGSPVQLGFTTRDAQEVSSFAATQSEGPNSRRHSESFDAVVLCAALGAPALLRPLGLRVPLTPIHGYSITLPMRLMDAHGDRGPRAALMDERYKVAITRLGDRVRVAGSAELGGAADRFSDKPLATLYKVLDDWFPGAAQVAKAQRWKGSRPMLPDGPPLIGAAGPPGVWLNLGHGSSGWALACGSARRVAESLSSGRPA